MREIQKEIVVAVLTVCMTVVILRCVEEWMREPTVWTDLYVDASLTHSEEESYSSCTEAEGEDCVTFYTLPDTVVDREGPYFQLGLGDRGTVVWREVDETDTEGWRLVVPGRVD